MAPPVIRTLLDLTTPDSNDDGSIFAARDALFRRDNEAAIAESHKGIIHPESINNNALFALFGIIGAAIVCVGIWFFFWAKNGGFYFKDDDWDDYKSTVLRRKGPNGTLLTGATPSTILGGGSVYKDVADDGSTDITGDTRTVVTESTEMSGITAGVSDFAGREKRRKKREAKDRDRERRREEKKLTKENTKNNTRKVDAEGNVVDEDAEAEAKAHLRQYRHERPARVGGINKESEGSNWDSSTNPSASSAGGSGYGQGSDVTSELMSNRERTPTSTPTKSGGIRKVYSAVDRREDRETERIRAEARRLQEKGRAAGSSSVGSSAAGSSPRRNFSFQRADDTSSFTSSPARRMPAVDERSEAQSSRVPGSWAESDAGSEVGTKTYKHVIPGLSSSGARSETGTATTDFAYQEEKRKRRGGAGYRRGRDAE